MRYLNLGCGYHYSTDPRWTNLDFESTGPGVIGHNLLQGIPFGDQTFDLVYHSHVLEHFSRGDGRRFLSECLRVLRSGGTLRIAVPDLEGIVRNYLQCLEAGVLDPTDKQAQANYDWMLLELFDQTVRHRNGGEMGEYLARPDLPNEAFVFGRIGEEGRAFRNMILAQPKSATTTPKGWLSGAKQQVRDGLLKLLGATQQQLDIGRFRTGGEIHQWMYDRYALGQLLQDLGARDIQVVDATGSRVDGWNDFELDTIAGQVRKPDSLFLEAVKP